MAEDAACTQSSDQPDGPPLVVTQRLKTGRRGRPRIEIDTRFLEQALDLRGTTHIAPILGCHPRTIRRRALEAGLVATGTPLFSSTEQPDGTVIRVHTSSTRPMSTLTNEELDNFIHDILEVFPAFGRRMLSGHLKDAGHHVPRNCIAASYLRVHGTPGIFGDQTIHRRHYSVAGANSLWHHNGQHGLSFLLQVLSPLIRLAHNQVLFDSNLSYIAL